MNQKNVATWLESKYIEWMSDSGQRHTISEFAEWLDISRSLMSRYLSGSRTPSRKNADKIAARLGPEIYDLLGLQRPDPQLIHIQTNWEFLTEEERQHFVSLVDDAVERGKKRF